MTGSTVVAALGGLALGVVVGFVGAMIYVGRSIRLLDEAERERDGEADP